MLTWSSSSLEEAVSESPSSTLTSAASAAPSG
eukprot:CAMPEP_0172891462 /NCGR_PEP_ID=MMETSP1075-20121228/143907_1 /TAXON_ID=2916 /ORGANISM="Ceratium fusus, Strain PA161109" /LENGTH=31 /DNA_ID= /DNA_START= /DNA_END= /DNA_ORIENTATION=